MERTLSIPRVLHVDDSESFLIFFQEVFKDDFIIIPAQNPQQAIELTDKEEFDVIITDYQLPDMNGIELMKKIHQKHPEIPVIFYSGQPDEEIVRKAFINGASDYFTKTPADFAHKEILHNNVKNLIEKSRIQKALKESETGFYELFNRSGSGILITEAAPGYQPGRIIDANIEACRILGYEKDELLKKTAGELIDTDDYKRVPEIIGKIFGEGHHKFGAHLISKGGAKLSVEVDAHKFWLGDKEVVLTIFNKSGSTKTEEKTFKRELSSEEITRELEEIHRTRNILLENVPGLIYRCKNDRNWTMKYMSDRALELTGYSPNEIIDNASISYNDIIHPDDRKYVWICIQDALRKKETFSVNYRIIAKAGTEKWVLENGRGIFDDNDRLKFIEGYIADISDDRRTFQMLKESEEKYRNLVEIAQDIVFTCDIQGKFIFVNSFFEIITGKKMSQIIGTNILDYVIDEDRENFAKSINKKICSNDKTISFEAGIKAAYNEIKYMRFNTVPLKDSKGHFTGITGMGYDITRQRKVEQDLISINRELNDFTYTVSHELKNPLNIINGYLNYIKDNPSTFADYYTRITEQSEKLIEYVSNLLKLSRSGRVLNEKAEIDLELLVRRVFAVSKPDKIISDFKITSSLPNIEGDSEKIETVFVNLIRNSIRYYDSQKEKLVIEVSCAYENGGVIICVADNGLGIAKENIEEIFKAGFTRGNSRGTGFGLAIVKKIMEAHGGKVWAESAGKGKGAKFFLKFPNSALHNPGRC